MKYEELKIDYPLKGVEAMSKDKILELKKLIKLDCLI
jgi:hypothetical protein